MHVARRLSEATGGTYRVALHEAHAEDCLMAHAPPPPSLAGSTRPSLVRMGFPQRAAALTLEAAGGEGDSGAALFFAAGEAGEYVCPRCRGRVAELPGTCQVCRLTLVSSPHLARSYHHLFPVQPFEELPMDGGGGGEAPPASASRAPPAQACYGCGEGFGGEGAPAAPRLRCPSCAFDFCFACDAFVHEQLHNCPGCEAAPEACC